MNLLISAPPNMVPREIIRGVKDHPSAKQFESFPNVIGGGIFEQEDILVLPLKS